MTKRIDRTDSKPQDYTSLAKLLVGEKIFPQKRDVHREVREGIKLLLANKMVTASKIGIGPDAYTVLFDRESEHTWIATWAAKPSIFRKGKTRTEAKEKLQIAAINHIDGNIEVDKTMKNKSYRDHKNN
jgi:predicted RNase H-like HicB family nuclease